MTANNLKEKSKVLAGVCARGGDYFNIDPVVLRIFFLMLAIFWGIGVLLYVLFAAFLPVVTKEKNENNS
ncbi:MAG: PspC domain-containing protein [Candidatus Omnitrophota bacterium]